MNDNHLLKDLKWVNQELTLACKSTIEGWVRALNLRDRETEGHSRCVPELTLRLARPMGIDDEGFVHIRHGVLLHDIGELGIPDAILFRPGKLIEEDRKL